MLHQLLSVYALDPLSWLFALCAGALIADHFGHAKLHRALLGVAAALLFGLIALPLDRDVARPLEDQYPRPTLPSHIDGIVVLDSGMSEAVFASRHTDGRTLSVQRMLAGVALARQFPGAKLVYSGNGEHNPILRKVRLAAGQHVVEELGLPPSRVIWETDSRNTYENLVDTMRLVRPKKGETWILVTSAVHMPRAMEIASKLGWAMTPWPSDYISDAAPGSSLELRRPAERLISIDDALHEWVGRIVYRLTGRAI